MDINNITQFTKPSHNRVTVETPTGLFLHSMLFSHHWYHILLKMPIHYLAFPKSSLIN